MGGFRVPYAPRQVYRPDDSRVTDLLLRRGDIEADRAERSGQIWGNALAQVGQQIGGALQQYGEQKALTKRDNAWVSYVKTGEWRKDPEAAFLKSRQIWGPQEGARQFQALEAASKVGIGTPEERMKRLGIVIGAAEKMDDAGRTALWPELRSLGTQALPEVKIPEAYDPKYWSGTVSPLGQQLRGEKPQGTRAVEILNPDGSKTTKIVKDEAGQTFESAAPAAKPPTPSFGSEKVLLDGKPALVSHDNHTGRYILNGQDVTMRVAPIPDKPVQGPAPDYEWILRNGDYVQIRKGTAQPGDTPASVRERQATGQERTALAFYNDAVKAAKDVDDVADKVGSGALLHWTPNMLQTDEQQKYWQGVRTFAEAHLRKRSGATITNDELKGEALKFFKQPGDSEAVLKQKKASRDTIIEGIRIEAGRAYAEYYGEEPPSPRNGLETAPPQSGGNPFRDDKKKNPFR